MRADDPEDRGAHQDVRGRRPPPPRPRRRGPHALRERGRDLRLRRAQRRRQDDHHQDAHGAHLPDQREGLHLRRAHPERGVEAAHRLPPRAPGLVRVPHRRRGDVLLRRAGRRPEGGARPPRGGAARPRRPGGRRRPPAPEVLEGHAAASRHRPGARGRPGLRRPRRADERPRPGRPQGDAGPHPRAQAARQDRLLLDPHPPRRRDALRPGRRHHRRAAPGRREAGRAPLGAGHRRRDHLLGPGRRGAIRRSEPRSRGTGITSPGPSPTRRAPMPPCARSSRRAGASRRSRSTGRRSRTSSCDGSRGRSTRTRPRRRVARAEGGRGRRSAAGSPSACGS